MHFWILFFQSFSYTERIILLLPVCGIYIILIGPLIFRFWVIPKVENRYRTKLIFNYPAYFYPGSSWTAPHWEISYYIFFKYIGWSKPLRNPNVALAKINYDVATASKAEIIMSFVTVFIFILLIISGAISATIKN